MGERKNNASSSLVHLPSSPFPILTFTFFSELENVCDKLS